MLKGSVVIEQPEPLPPPEKEEVIHLQEEDVKAIIRCLMDLSYDPKTDVYQCPPKIIDLAEELGVN